MQSFSYHQPQAKSRRSDGPAYLVRWLTRTGELCEDRARGGSELTELIRDIENDNGELMVACATFYFTLER